MPSVAQADHGGERLARQHVGGRHGLRVGKLLCEFGRRGRISHGQGRNLVRF
jgi:hypothetical protein